jgi:sialic acid synthase
MSDRSISIGKFEISDNSNPFIIAEVGHNHQGKIESALSLIRSAAAAGASAVKFQTRQNSTLFTPSMFESEYNSENAFGPTYGAHREALELSPEDYQACIDEAQKAGILFFSTAFDVPSARFLASLEMPAFKIASGDLRSDFLLKEVASFGKPMIVSTGGATIEQVDHGVALLRAEGAKFALLQCTAGYPPMDSEINLRVIQTFRERYSDLVIGYSGHDSGITMAIASYVLGARVIEKHFTLDRTLKGTDHAFSLEPEGMRKLVKNVNAVRVALGDGVKRSYPSEANPLRKMGKMIIASSDLSPGHVIREADLDFRSPNEGLGPDLAHLLIGKQLVAGKKRYEPFKAEDVI